MDRVIDDKNILENDQCLLEIDDHPEESKEPGNDQEVVVIEENQQANEINVL